MINRQKHLLAILVSLLLQLAYSKLHLQNFSPSPHKHSNLPSKYAALFQWDSPLPYRLHLTHFIFFTTSNLNQQLKFSKLLDPIVFKNLDIPLKTFLLLLKQILTHFSACYVLYNSNPPTEFTRPFYYLGLGQKHWNLEDYIYFNLLF